eukprot:Em0001g1084a
MWDVYNHVADILLKMEQRRGSMKSLVFSLRDISLPAKKNIFALACRTLERKSVIDRVLESTSLLQKEPQLQYHLALVMVFDLLFGKCRLQCTGSIKRALMKHQAELLAAIAKELPKQQHSRCSAIPVVMIPQLFLKVNRHISLDIAIFAFDKDKTRLLTLNKMVQNAGAACVTTKLQDFLTVV